MAFYRNIVDEPDSFVTVEPIYNYDNLSQNQKLLFDFHVDYTRAPEVDSDGEEDLENLDTLSVHQTREFDTEWVISGDRDQIQALVYHILDSIESPCYSDIVTMLTDAILELKRRNADSTLPHVERIEVKMDLIAWRFPGEDDHHDVDVILEVPPASDESVENNFETVVLEKDPEDCCAICLDMIQVSSGVAVGRLPCSHVFHRSCGVEWLRNSGVCPLCRAVLPP